jgi:hypothetical protein
MFLLKDLMQLFLFLPMEPTNKYIPVFLPRQ